MIVQSKQASKQKKKRREEITRTMQRNVFEWEYGEHMGTYHNKNQRLEASSSGERNLSFYSYEILYYTVESFKQCLSMKTTTTTKARANYNFFSIYDFDHSSESTATKYSKKKVYERRKKNVYDKTVHMYNW